MAFEKNEFFETKRLVSMFHQDYDLLDGLFSNKIMDHIKLLSEERSIILRNELRIILNLCRNNHEVIEKFYSLGADFVPQSDDYIRAVKDVLERGPGKPDDIA
jgi:hypothetical protein